MTWHHASIHCPRVSYRNRDIDGYRDRARARDRGKGKHIKREKREGEGQRARERHTDLIPSFIAHTEFFEYSASLNRSYEGKGKG